jgi:Mg-chelatase subunit ChlI
MANIKYKNIIPFTAIVGQERMKTALILNIINPNIGGVIISGDKGTGKSTAVRALACLLPEINVVKDCFCNCDPEDQETMCSYCLKRKEHGGVLPVFKRKIRLIDLPLGVSEDRLLGTIDIEKALKEGVKALEPGILADANRGILYVDEVNLLDDTIADILLDSAAMGINTIEREGIAVFHPSNFTLVASMNPEEGDLRPQLLDRFGLYVRVQAITDMNERLKIARLINEFETNAEAIRKRYEDRQDNLSTRIQKAIDMLPRVTVNEKLLRFCAYLVTMLNIKTHRAEINLIRAATAKAAYDGELDVTLEHLKGVADLVLTHRTATKPFEEPYLDHSLLNKKMSEIEQILDYSAPPEKPRLAEEKNKEMGTDTLAGISMTDEGEIFGVGKFYSERSWEKFGVKKN